MMLGLHTVSLSCLLTIFNRHLKTLNNWDSPWLQWQTLKIGLGNMIEDEIRWCLFLFLDCSAICVYISWGFCVVVFFNFEQLYKSMLNNYQRRFSKVYRRYGILWLWWIIFCVFWTVLNKSNCRVDLAVKRNQVYLASSLTVSLNWVHCQCFHFANSQQ